MIVHYVRNLAIFCFVFMTTACNINRGKSVSQPSGLKDTLVFTGCQEKINVKAGSMVEIRLEAIQGTGFQWLLKEPSSLIQQIEPDVLEFDTPEAKEGTPGQAGFQVLRFKTLEKGSGEVLLEYKRTFEEQVEKSCLIKIVVE